LALTNNQRVVLAVSFIIPALLLLTVFTPFTDNLNVVGVIPGVQVTTTYTTSVTSAVPVQTQTVVYYTTQIGVTSTATTVTTSNGVTSTATSVTTSNAVTSTTTSVTTSSSSTVVTTQTTQTTFVASGSPRGGDRPAAPSGGSNPPGGRIVGAWHGLDFFGFNQTLSSLVLTGSNGQQILVSPEAQIVFFAFLPLIGLMLFLSRKR
jgi:hypothetical protein